MNEDLRSLTEVDRIIHEPARLVILAVLYAVESADFLYLLKETDLTRGNLSAHLSKLEAAGFIGIEKTFVGKIPRTVCRLTQNGKAAFEDYRQRMQRFFQNPGLAGDPG